MPDQKQFEQVAQVFFSVMWVPKLLLTPKKIRMNVLIWPKIGFFGQINNAKKVRRWFSCYIGTKTFASSQKKNLAKNWHFFHFGPNIGIFGPFCFMPDQKTMRTKCLGSFSVMWVPKLLLSSVKIRIFCPKTTKFGPKLAFLVIFGQILAFLAHLVSCPTKKQCEQDA